VHRIGQVHVSTTTSRAGFFKTRFPLVIRTRKTLSPASNPTPRNDRLPRFVGPALGRVQPAGCGDHDAVEPRLTTEHRLGGEHAGRRCRQRADFDGGTVDRDHGLIFDPECPLAPCPGALTDPFLARHRAERLGAIDVQGLAIEPLVGHRRRFDQQQHIAGFRHPIVERDVDREAHRNSGDGGR